jgi:hypothetical protein
MKPEDRTALVGYVQDMRKFREILKKNGEQV